MHAAFLLGSVIVLVLIVADWRAFRRDTAGGLRYGVPVSRRQDTLVVRRTHFDANGILQLPRGAARLFSEERAILLLPDKRRLGMVVRTAWPLNGSVHYQTLEEPVAATLIKRMPWSSVLLTALWFLIVAVGMLIYLVSYGLAGGFSSASGAFLALALCGLGLLVLLFGIVVVVVGYRLENRRLMTIYEEFKAAIS
jgi:hypothetical protein